MKSCWKFSLVAPFSLLVCGSVFAYQLAMKNGSVAQFQKYRVESGRVIYTDAAGNEVPVALAEVDMERTKSLNAEETPPLDLTGATAKPAETATDSSEEPQSLGDAARALRQQGKAHAAGQKRAYTDDDVTHAPDGEVKTVKAEAPSAPAAGAPAGNSGSPTNGASNSKKRALSDQEVSELYDLGRVDTARAMLRGANLPPDTPFPDRADWESRLFETKQDMIHAYFRAKERPDDDDAYNAWVDKWNAFADVANDGIRRARAYLRDHPQG